MKLDPFVVEVIRHGLSAAAEEMSLVMTRSARSPLLREAGDLSSAITDGQRRPGRAGPRHPDPSRRDGLHHPRIAEGGAASTA